MHGQLLPQPDGRRRGKVIHASFDDPPRMAVELAKQGADAEQQLNGYRKIRDEIKAFVEKMPENINNRIVWSNQGEKKNEYGRWK